MIKISLLFFLFLPLCSLAQESVVVKGIVKDISSKEPISGVTVTYFKSNNHVENKITTDEKGAFELSLSAEVGEKYYFIAEKEGYSSHKMVKRIKNKHQQIVLNFYINTDD